MGYQLVFHALEWATLRAALDGRFPDLARHVALSARLPGERPYRDIAPAVGDLLGGPLGRSLASGMTTEADDRQAVAFVAIVRAMGRPIAELNHNSAAGSRFRDRFIDGTLRRMGGGIDGYPIVDRPICGLSHAGYPGWGGLTLAEIAGPYAPLAAGGADLDDEDEDDWLQSIAEALATAASLRSDIVTLYY